MAATGLGDLYTGGYGGPGWTYAGKTAKLKPIVGAGTGQTADSAGTMAAAAARRPATQADIWAPVVNLIKGSIQTPQQIAAMASQQAVARENATLAAQKAASDKVIQGYNDQAARAQGFATALATAQQGAYGDAQQTYNQAANTLQGLGAGLTGATSADYQAGVDQTRAALDALTQGRGESTAPSAGGIFNASQYGGVTIPAGSLAADAANAARMAAGDVTARSENIANIARNYTAQANQALMQAADDARALVAQRPANIADLVNTLTQNRQQGIQNLASVLGQRASAKLQADQMAQQGRQFSAQMAQTRSQMKQQATQFQTQLGETQRQFDLGRKDDLAQQAIDNANTTRTLDISERGLEGTLRNQTAAITGRDPKTGLPTFDAQQWSERTDEWRKSYALSMSNGMHYEIDPATGNARIRNGHVVPMAGYKVNPKDPYNVVVDPKQTSAGMKAANMPKVDLKLSDRYKHLVDVNGNPIIKQDKNGNPVWVPLPGAPAKKASPMKATDRQTFMQNMSQAAKTLAGGQVDKDGNVVAGTAVDPADAFAQMAQNFPLDQYPWMLKLAMDDLRTEYKKVNPDWTPYQTNRELFPSFLPGPEPRGGELIGGVSDPKANLQGQTWDKTKDPFKTMNFTTGMFQTKSGRWVNPDTGLYLKP